MTLLEKAINAHNIVGENVSLILNSGSEHAATEAITLMQSSNTLALLALADEQRTANIIAYYNMTAELSDDLEIQIATRMGLL